MTLETKLTPGEKAWVLYDDRVQNIPVGSVTVKVCNRTDGAPIGAHTVEITYGFRTYAASGAFKEWKELPESLVHRTRQALLDSL
jgi:hypothetical protein